MKVPVKVGMLISFDWELIKNSLPLLYGGADLITLGIDRNRKTWSGKIFDLPDTFYEYIKSIDKRNIINFCEGEFYLPGLSPMQMEVNARNVVADHMKKDGWHLQVDVDEYFLNFPEFANFLRKRNSSLKSKPLNVTCGWITLFKKLESGYLIVSHQKNKPALVPVATNYPVYEYGRVNGSYNVFSGCYMIHDSWARGEEGLLEKLKNWSHKNDFNVDQFFNFWKSMDINNYKNVKNFHPLQPHAWPSLEYVEGENIAAFIENFLKKNRENIVHNPLELYIRNSKLINKLRSLLK